MKNLLIIFFLLFSLSSYSQSSLREVEIVSQRKHIDTIQGIDISVYQGKIDWPNIDTNVRFIIIKASEGIARTDNRFKYNWENCNIVKGGYHFFRPQFSGRKQGKLFLSLLKINKGDIKPVIDVEYTPYWYHKRHIKTAINNLSQMIEYIEDETNVTPIIYTSLHFWNKYILPNYKGDLTLWIADYRNQGPPDAKWSIWQYTCKGKVSGIKPPVDMNICVQIDTLLVK